MIPNCNVLFNALNAQTYINKPCSSVGNECTIMSTIMPSDRLSFSAIMCMFVLHYNDVAWLSCITMMYMYMNV